MTQYIFLIGLDIESAAVILVKSWFWRFQVHDRIEMLVTTLAWRISRGGSSTVDVTESVILTITAKSVTNIINLSSMHLFFNARHQHRCNYFTLIWGPKTGSFQEWDYIQHHSCILRILLIEFSFAHLQFSSSVAMNYRL